MAIPRQTACFSAVIYSSYVGSGTYELMFKLELDNMLTTTCFRNPIDCIRLDMMVMAPWILAADAVGREFQFAPVTWAADFGQLLSTHKLPILTSYGDNCMKLQIRSVP